jgi:hypothetical protein
MATTAGDSVMSRTRLANRRPSVTFGFDCNGLRYTCTASWFCDGRLAEVFLGNHRCDSHADSCAKDAAILASLSLQHGVLIDQLRRALLRDARGRPSTPIGVALDTLAEWDGT